MAQKIPYLIAIILICVAPMADTYVLIPAISDIGKALPDASLTKLNLILTITSLFVVPSSLLAGKLVEIEKISKKNCLLLGFGLFSIGGAAGGLFVNANYILFTRAIQGVGSGFATAMVVSITADYFTEKEGATVMGLYTAVGSLIAIGLTMLSGYLVLINWRLAFLVYLICILIFIYHAIILKGGKGPKIKENISNDRPVALETDSDLVSNKPYKLRLGTAVWILIGITILSQTLGNSLYLSLSHFIEGQNLGDASSTGIANGVLTGSMVLMGLVFGKIYGKIGKQTSFFMFFLLSVGFFILGRSHSFSMAIVSLVIWGLGYGLTIPYVMQEAIVCPPKRLITFTGSLVNSCIFLSFVMSTFVQPLFNSLTDSNDIRSFYATVSIILFGCGIISIFIVKFGAKPLGRTS
jgi:MFS family permease